MKKKPRRRDPDVRMLETVGKYLERHGWNVLVIGSARVQHQPVDWKNNYEFVLRFTGAQKQPPVADAAESKKGKAK